MKLKLSLAVAVLAMLFVAVGFSCKRITTVEKDDALYYFPARNVYYDSRQFQYYYSLNGGISWDSLTFKDSGYGKALGQKIAIQRTGENAWLNNEQDRKKYDGILLNTVNSNTVSITKTDSVRKLKPVVKPGPEPAIVEKDKQPEKGLKKFFNKLFGKKKKQSEEKQ